MNTEISSLLIALKTNTLTFNQVIAFIETHYQHTPTAFKNGEAENDATQNQGSAKVFAFAKIHQLSASKRFIYLPSITKLYWLLQQQPTTKTLGNLCCMDVRVWFLYSLNPIHHQIHAI